MPPKNKEVNHEKFAGAAFECSSPDASELPDPTFLFEAPPLVTTQNQDPRVAEAHLKQLLGLKVTNNS